MESWLQAILDSFWKWLKLHLTLSDCTKGLAAETFVRTPEENFGHSLFGLEVSWKCTAGFGCEELSGAL